MQTLLLPSRERGAAIAELLILVVSLSIALLLFFGGIFDSFQENETGMAANQALSLAGAGESLEPLVEFNPDGTISISDNYGASLQAFGNAVGKLANNLSGGTGGVLPNAAALIQYNSYNGSSHCDPDSGALVNNACAHEACDGSPSCCQKIRDSISELIPASCDQGIAYVAAVALRYNDPADTGATNKVSVGGFSARGGQGILVEPCFTAETPVLMQDGSWRAIADVEEGEKVVSLEAFSPLTQIETAKVVKALRTSSSEVILELNINGEYIRTTRTHPFYVSNREMWLNAGDIKVGDQVRSISGNDLPVLAARVLADREPVYNLALDGPHTYFVGSQGIWVHNLQLIDTPADIQEKNPFHIFNAPEPRHAPAPYLASGYGGDLGQAGGGGDVGYGGTGGSGGTGGTGGTGGSGGTGGVGGTGGSGGTGGAGGAGGDVGQAGNGQAGTGGGGGSFGGCSDYGTAGDGGGNVGGDLGEAGSGQAGTGGSGGSGGSGGTGGTGGGPDHFSVGDGQQNLQQGGGNSGNF